MHITKFPQMKESIEQVYKNFVFNKKVLPSMRSLQFGGKAVELNNARIYNCAFLPVDNIRSFSETMFLLLGGTGVGYSVQNHNIDKLPEIRKPNYDRKKRYVVQDSIIGWADAIKTLFKSYTGELTSHIEFDLSDIRQKGALLVTAGRPSRGRRRFAVRGMYIVSVFFLALLAFGYLLGPLVPDGKPAPHLLRTMWTEVFTLFYVGAMVWAGVTFARAYSLMLTRSGRKHTFSEADVVEYKKAWSQKGALTGMINWYRAVMRRGLRHAFSQKKPGARRVTIPTLMLWGKRDIALSSEMAQPSIDLCDQGKLIFFDKATHWVQHDASAEVNQKLIEFMS